MWQAMDTPSLPLRRLTPFPPLLPSAKLTILRQDTELLEDQMQVFNFNFKYVYAIPISSLFMACLEEIPISDAAL